VLFNGLSILTVFFPPTHPFFWDVAACSRVRQGKFWQRCACPWLSHSPRGIGNFQGLWLPTMARIGCGMPSKARYWCRIAWVTQAQCPSPVSTRVQRLSTCCVSWPH
jgi:hypothetical protein